MRASTMKPGKLSHRGTDDQDRQEVNDCLEGDNHKDNEDEKSPSGADEKEEGDEIESIDHDKCESVDESPSLTIKEQMRAMFVRMMFSQIVTEKLWKTKR